MKSLDHNRSINYRLDKSSNQIFSCRSIVFCLFFTFKLSTILNAQDVKISRDINIRNDFAYDLLNVNDQLYFYRDKGFQYFFDIFDKDLNYRRTVDINLEDKKAFVESVVSFDSCINIIYSFKKQNEYIIKGLKLDAELNPIDTVELVRSILPLEIGAYRTVFSEDKSKVMLFSFRRDKIEVLLVQNKSFDVILNKDFVINDYKLLPHFKETCVSNNGEAFFLFEKSNESWEKEDHFMRLFSIINNQEHFSDISCKNTVNSGVKMSVDNLNDRLIFAGLWGENGTHESKGYFVFNQHIQSLTSTPLFDIRKFMYDENIIADLNGVLKKEKKNILHDFSVVEIVHRVDGGILLITELIREFSRRNAGLPNFERAVSPSRGYVDYYNEDIIIFSMNANGELQWRKILFKKQFSQDDEGIYSSFFLMKVPSQMHILFNDEIKNNNTVSEYIIDPLGNFKRNSILSTEYKNLKLRFQDGIQVSGNSFVVPSEKSSKINLVKIIF